MERIIGIDVYSANTVAKWARRDFLFIVVSVDPKTRNAPFKKGLAGACERNAVFCSVYVCCRPTTIPSYSRFQ